MQAKNFFQNCAAVVLAAGKGTRMKSELQKTVHLLLGKPIVGYIIDTLKHMGFSKVVIVVGHNSQQVIDVLGEVHTYAFQKEQKGNANALMAAKDYIDKKCQYVFVFQGDDSFMFTPETIKMFFQNHIASKATISALTCSDDVTFPDTFWFVKSTANKIIKVFSGEQRGLDTKMLISTYIFNKEWLWENITKLTPSTVSGEYILPDLIQLALSQGCIVEGVNVEYKKDWFGVNSQDELKEAEELLANKR